MKEITPRQQEIIAAALALISDRGLEALTIKNIAARVGSATPRYTAISRTRRRS